jgi:hypothetical protein
MGPEVPGEARALVGAQQPKGSPVAERPPCRGHCKAGTTDLDRPRLHSQPGRVRAALIRTNRVRNVAPRWQKPPEPSGIRREPSAVLGNRQALRALRTEAPIAVGAESGMLSHRPFRQALDISIADERVATRTLRELLATVTRSSRCRKHIESIHILRSTSPSVTVQQSLRRRSEA